MSTLVKRLLLAAALAFGFTAVTPAFGQETENGTEQTEPAPDESATEEPSEEPEETEPEATPEETPDEPQEGTETSPE